MFCSNCGKELPEDAAFCSECGTRVERPEAMGAQSPVAPPVQEALSQQTPDLAGEPRKQKKKAKKQKTSGPKPEAQPAGKQPGKKKSKKVVLIPLFVLLGVLAVGGITALALWNSPRFRHGLELKKADGAMERQEYEAAVEYYQSALDWEPDSEEAQEGLTAAYLGMGDALYEQKLYGDALTAYEKALKKDKKNKDALEGQLQCRLALGKQSCAAGEYQEALEYFDAVLESDAENEEAASGKRDVWLGLGSESLEQGAYDKALDYYGMVLEQDPGCVAAYSGAVEVRLAQDQVLEAMELLHTGYEATGDASLKERADYVAEHTVILRRSYESEDGNSLQEYDENGNLLRENYFEDSAMAYFDYEGIYEYDDAGRCVYHEYQEFDGGWGYSERREYDGAGNETLYQFVSSDGTGYYQEKEYDGNGNCTMVAEYDYSTDELEYAWYHEYDGKGNCTKDARYNADGSSNIFYYEYDASGNCITEKWENNSSNGSYTGETDYHYDDKGNVVSWVSYGDGVVDQSMRAEYDEKGNQTLEEYYYGNIGDSEPYSAYYSEYDQWGNRTYGTTSSGYESVHSYEYDDSGNILRHEEESYRGDGTLESTSCQEYDQDGNCLHSDYAYYAESDSVDYESYDWTYDEFGRIVSYQYDSDWGDSIYDEYRYDALGNQVEMLRDGSVYATTQYTYHFGG